MESEVKVAFLCGCQHVAAAGLPVDEEGFVTCPHHPSIRRYGWRSPIMRAHKSYPFDENDPKYVERPWWSLSHAETEMHFWLRLGISIILKEETEWLVPEERDVYTDVLDAAFVENEA